MHDGIRSTFLRRLLPALLAASCLYLAPPPAQALDALPAKITEPRKGDLDAMIKRRQIRALVYWSKTDYFITNGQQRGISYEFGRDLEKYINTKLKTGKKPVSVVMIPVSRDKLISYLEQGRADITIAGLRPLAERSGIDFSLPVHDEVSEVVVRNHSAAPITKEEDVGGKIFHLRPSSSYFYTLKAINERLHEKGLPTARIEYLNENLADSDIMEMVNAGLIDYTILDDFRGQLWSDIFPQVDADKNAPLVSNQTIALGLRKNAPKLKALIDGYVKQHKVGTAYGNILAKRYFVSNPWARNALSGNELARFHKMVGIFRRYADTYKFDYLMLTAQGFQESGLDQNRRSRVGAVGVMQVMPSTGKSMKVGNIYQLDPNIHAGVKYMSHLADTYFDDPAIDPLNRTLLCFAAYNAGPSRISALREVARKRGLNPNVWFDNVETVVAERVGRETVQYVVNISKYYVAYKLVEEQQKRREDAVKHLKEAAN
ncbi:MAG: transglycosylase SLT domain-containing protein [Pedobacter sp.]|nr:transglycosylase SLT domain-containing protein [Pedobacter sp.]